MTGNPVLGFVGCKLIAQQQGVSDDDSNRAGIVGAVMGFTPIAIAATVLIARNQAPVPPPASTTKTPSGTIVSGPVKPAPGTPVETPAVLVRMPNLVGMRKADARAALAKLFPKEPAIVHAEISNSQDAGTVINTFPAANTSFDPTKTAIEFTISQGPVASEKGELEREAKVRA